MFISQSQINNEEIRGLKVMKNSYMIKENNR